MLICLYCRAISQAEVKTLGQSHQRRNDLPEKGVSAVDCCIIHLSPRKAASNTKESYFIAASWGSPLTPHEHRIKNVGIYVRGSLGDWEQWKPKTLPGIHIDNCLWPWVGCNREHFPVSQSTFICGIDSWAVQVLHTFWLAYKVAHGWTYSTQGRRRWLQIVSLNK